ncbi:ComEA family DNA-binding protein [Chengkuizengella marina]|uniref:Helix-hairpin-helix domain-containing protein n=1 Tax=Chengkuizengella marina TaxID=2507566 RepID=A0A6N9Q402_9BACL|nr:helix-hairpin-helix domain-containing protein [Chengkuizengella marina]NBI29500.1 helix-hairpin-helix domain-containing protein [Chengkuizengella marina]
MSLSKLKEIRSILWIILILCIVFFLLLEMFILQVDDINELEKVNDQVEDVLLLNDVGTSQTTDELEDKETILPGKINVNKASVQQLMTLPNIGEVKAQAIVDFREEHGRFLTRNELMNVTGIGEKTVEKLKGLITF